MICPRCGEWIDEGEPYCPGCTWDGDDDDDEYYDNDYNQPSSTYSNTQNTSTYTHTINNDTQKIENEKPKNDTGSDPLTCCCGGLIILWILGTIMQFLGL